MTRSERLLSVSELLVLNLLAVDEVLGHDGSAMHQVSQVVPGTSVRTITALPAGTLVVFDRAQLAAEDVSTDLAIRLAVSVGLAGIVAQSPPERPVPEATRRLAAKFSMPVILLKRVDTADVVASLDSYVRAPEVAAAELLRQAIRQLCVAPEQPELMLRRVSRVLGCPAVLMAADGAVVSGRIELDDEISATVRDRAGAAPTPQTAVLTDGDVLVLQPAVLAVGAASNLWLVTRVGAGCDLLIDTAQQALSIAATAFTAHVALNEVKLQQTQRDRALLLGDILEAGESPTRAAVEHATALGWRLWGWHVGVHIGVRRPAARLRASEFDLGLERALVDAGLATSPVARPDASVFWVTSEAEPTPQEIGALANRLHEVLVVFERKHLGLSLHAGLGRPHRGIAGIAQSLQEAKEAAALALGRDGPAPVDYVDALNVRRLVADWYSAGPLRELAAALIQPLWAADSTGDLVRTLCSYLDHESSATSAAGALHVHRNTVLYRMARIRELLNVDLDQCDDRLAVHLAARASLSEPPSVPAAAAS